MLKAIFENPDRSLETAEEVFQDALGGSLGRLGPEWVVLRHKSGPVCWCQFTRKEAELPAQGWKIHVSAATSEAVVFCQEVLPWLLRRGITGKIVADLASLICLNSGEAGETQTGKFLTVYPANDLEARAIALELDRRWPTTLGPVVPSDLALRAHGSVFLRYGAFDGPSNYDRFGKRSSLLRDPNGILVEDARSMVGRQPDWATPPIDGLVPALEEIEGPVGSHDDLYLPFQLLAASPGAKVFLGLSLSDASEVLIKLRRRGVGAGLEGAADERLSAESQVLNILNKAQGIAPKLLCFAPGPGYSVLVTEYLEGELLSDLDFDSQISHLVSLARAIAQLHKAGFAHRDIKLSNAVVRENVVRLIDFELATPIGSERPVSAGTRGHMPPERSAMETGAGDVFALGSCLAHVYLGFDPGGLPEGGGRLVGLLDLFGFGSISRLVQRLVDPNPDRRPSAEAAVEMIQSRPSDGEGNKGSYHASVPAAWCLRAAEEAARSTRVLRLASGSGFVWESRHYDGMSSAEGLNIGSAGIVLGLISVDQACGHERFREDIKGGVRWLATGQPYEKAHGIFTGNAGVALALAVAGRRYGSRDWVDQALVRLRHAARVEQECDLFSGAAGVLWSAYLVSDILDDPSILGLVSDCGDRLLGLSEIREGVIVWPSGGPEKVPLTGAAHGSAGIAMALALWGRKAERQDAIDFSFEVFERLYSNGRLPRGEVLRRTVSEPSEGAPVLSWCHGVGGYLWCMLQAFGDDPQLATALDWCVSKCAEEKPSGSPVYCHGLAGELELWRMVGRYPCWASDASRRADRAAGALRLMLRRQNGLCLWGAEDPEVITPDLWVGLLGPATALALHGRMIQDSILSSPWLSACASERP